MEGEGSGLVRVVNEDDLSLEEKALDASELAAAIAQGEAEGEEYEDDDDEDADEMSSEIGDPAFEGSLRLKCRQHVNPLASRYQVPVVLEPDWLANAFVEPHLPIIVDVGCAKGTWALKTAQTTSGLNVLGLEIRRPVVDFALKRKSRWALPNVHFLGVNANVDLDRILKELVARKVSIEMVTFHHPDPHFKKKHKKRRVVNQRLVAQIASSLAPGSRLFLQSDIMDVMQDMVESFHNNEHFVPASGHFIDKLETNPSPHTIKTEREVATQKKGLPVYRMLFLRA